MAHIGQELAFGAVRFFSLIPCVEGVEAGFFQLVRIFLHLYIQAFGIFLGQGQLFILIFQTQLLAENRFPHKTEARR